jgi:hypothetical protein
MAVALMKLWKRRQVAQHDHGVLPRLGLENPLDSPLQLVELEPPKGSVTGEQLQDLLPVLVTQQHRVSREAEL